VAGNLPQAARNLLEVQIALLRSDESSGAKGRFVSAATVVLNVLRGCGRIGQAADFDRKYQECLHTGDFRKLIDAIGAVFDADDQSVSTSEPQSAEAAAQEPSARTLRVDVGRIDALVKLAGEMTVVRNAFAHAVDLAQNGAASDTLTALLKNQHGALDRLVDELQMSALNMRVLPMRHVFQRFPRLVRDLAEQLGKPVRLIMDGEDTEADKTVVEKLAEPLVHVIRNAIDHGIEAEPERVKSGKAASGTIRISAHREGENVIVVVADDGAGIDTARIRAIAAEREVLPPDAIQALSDEEVTNIIFMPGFSTAKEVTGVSGRGVGMDAVRSAVERLGGRVSLQSNPGRGTSVRFSLPFSVMVSQVMTATAAGQDFGVPLESVLETVRVPATQVVPVGGAHAFVLRDQTIPLIDLAQLVGGAKSFPSARSDYEIMVVAIEGQMVGLVVERLGERMDVMLRPLDGLIAGTPGVAGTSLVADGRVLLVLDLLELLQ
jgi:two-component system chemotaxis sensor kinase CheA